MVRGSEVVLIGYSGHAFVVCDIFDSMDVGLKGYCEEFIKDFNPYGLSYLGRELEFLALINRFQYFVAIGDNKRRRTVSSQLIKKLNYEPVSAVHSSSMVSVKAEIAAGVMICPGVVINSCSTVGMGTICNSRSVIEHECNIGAYCHIAPGAVLCGSVTLGDGSFVGAGAIIKEGITIGDNVLIGAGAVIIKNVPSDTRVVGNPQRYI